MKLRQSIATWALMGILLVHTFGINALYGLYLIDQALFVELFCVNTDKPKMQCKGTCMLSKLGKQPEKSPDFPPLPDITQFQLHFYVPDFDFELAVLSFPKKGYPFHYQNFHESKYINEPLKPPIAV